MPAEAADEVVRPGAERDVVVPRAIRGAGASAAVVAAGVHRHHVVHGRIVVEHEYVPGAEVLAAGPAVRTHRPVDLVGGSAGDVGAEEKARDEQADDETLHRTASSLCHGCHSLCCFSAASWCEVEI